MHDVRADWDEAAAALTVSGVGLTVTAQVGEVYLTANGRCLYVPDGIFRSSGLVYAPVRTVCKIFGATVTWSEKKRAVYIRSGTELIQSGSEFYDSQDLTWLSRIIQAESGGESLLGKIAVGNVVLNRVKSTSYPDTVYGVIFDHRYGVTQFTPTATGAIYNKPSAQSVLAAKLALDGADVAGGSIYFFGKSVTSGWIRSSLTFVSNIGNHNFYM
jgi:N-acetylmuramoyl-L-alanine amidase